MVVSRIGVLLATGREIFREGLTAVLGRYTNINVVGKCSEVLEVAKEALELRPDVLILDTEMLNEECIELLQKVSQKLPKLRIIFMTLSYEKEHLVSALMVGATGYLWRGISGEELVKAIELVSAGETVISPPIAGKVVKEFISTGTRKWGEEESKIDISLSDREKEVLMLIVEGHTNKEIANSLFVTENTVKVHLHKIISKMHVRNRLQAVALAVEKGLIPRVTEKDILQK